MLLEFLVRKRPLLLLLGIVFILGYQKACRSTYVCAYGHNDAGVIKQPWWHGRVIVSFKHSKLVCPVPVVALQVRYRSCPDEVFLGRDWLT